MELYNDRRPAVADDHEWGLLHETPLDRDGLRAANTRLRNAAPEYRKADLNRQIRTTSVQRHRTRKSGGTDFASMGEYLNFMTGADSGGE